MSFMKLINISVLFCIITFSQAFAQEKILDVHHVFHDRPWLDQQTHTLWGHRVTMLLGEKFSHDRYANVRQTTGMGYQDLATTLDSLRQQAGEENWPVDSLEHRLTWYRENAPGGRLFLFITRYDEDAADTRFMYISVNGPDDKEQILRKELPLQAPELPEGYGWWNYVEIPLNSVMPETFFVYLKRTTNVDPIAGYRITPVE